MSTTPAFVISMDADIDVATDTENENQHAWEYAKENILPTRRGRKIGLVNRALLQPRVSLSEKPSSSTTDKAATTTNKTFNADGDMDEQGDYALMGAAPSAAKRQRTATGTLSKPCASYAKHPAAFDVDAFVDGLLASH